LFSITAFCIQRKIPYLWGCITGLKISYLLHKSEKMKRLLFTGAVCGVLNAAAQNNPKTVNPGIASVITSNNNIARISGVLDNFYIVDEKIWSKNTASDVISFVEDINDPAIIKWRAIGNGTGTFAICNSGELTKKLAVSVRVLSREELLSATRPAGGLPRQLIVSADASLPAANKDWKIKLINEDAYWLVNGNAMDSVRVRLIPVSAVPVNNVDFTFETMNGWDISEGSATNHAFTGQPSTINALPFYSAPVVPAMPLGGDYWKNLEDKFFSYHTHTKGKYIHTARPGSNKWAVPDETKTGYLTSKPFLLCSERLNYHIGGTQDSRNIKIELFQKVKTADATTVAFSDGFYKLVPASVTTGHNNDIARGVAVPLPGMKYTVCRLRITDNSATGHIMVSTINFQNKPTITTEAVPAGPVFPSATKPIWGAIDMHTHPMAFMGMGGKLMYGKLDGDPAKELNNCNEVHGGFGTDNPRGNYFRAEMVNMVDEHFKDSIVRYKLEDLKVPHNDHKHDGYPNFVHWPTQSSMIHQQMWYEWMRRAKDGGLKSIIALTVNSEVLGRALGGDAPYDDKTTADRQIDSLIAFVHRHRDFLDTATSAARMRQVVNEGKMAVIMGMEVDNIGNFYQNIQVTNEQIRNEITRLKNKGIRYIFPVHVTDNKFGGAAVYKDFFNFGNKYSSGQPVTSLNPNLYPPVLPGNLFKVETAPDRNIGFRLAQGELGEYLPLAIKMRPLLELIEAGGFPVIPPPPLVEPVFFSTTNLAVKATVDPAIIALRSSQQYQLAKKLFLDRNPELDTYAGIVRSATEKGGHRNISGISAEGDFFIKELMRQGMMIDMDHASEKSVNDIIRIAVRNDYPVNSGHNSLRGRNDNEKTRTRTQLDTMRLLGGMMGIGWEGQTPADFKNIYNSHVTVMGNKNTAFGSDIDGYAATPLKPVNSSQFVNYTNAALPDYLQKYVMPGSPKDWDYNIKGMEHIGMIPDFFQALKKAGMSEAQLNALFLSAEYFAQMWEKCERRAPLVER
jgi:microsomal dipeptidase-like Zn-dependent dipeptidase